jgi:hypothetical protein
MNVLCSKQDVLLLLKQEQLVIDLLIMKSQVPLSTLAHTLKLMAEMMLSGLHVMLLELMSLLAMLIQIAISTQLQ